MTHGLLTAMVIGILFGSALVRSTFGFGEALIAMPLLAGLVGVKVAAPLVAMMAGAISIIILVKDWRLIQVGAVKRLIGASLAGIPLGLLFLKGAQEELLQLLLAAGLIVFATLSLSQFWPVRLKNERLAYPFGFVAGVLGGALNTSGPPVVIYGSLRRWRRESFRATLQGYFLATGIATAAGHGAVGLWTPAVLEHFCCSLPAVVLAILMGDRFHASIPAEKFDRYIQVVLLLLGSGLLAHTALRRTH